MGTRYFKCKAAADLKKANGATATRYWGSVIREVPLVLYQKSLDTGTGYSTSPTLLRGYKQQI